MKYINSIKKWLKKQWTILKWRFKKIDDDDDHDHFIYD